VDALRANEPPVVSEELLLRLRIDALYAEYAQVIDDDKLEEWPGLFVESGRYRLTTRENYDHGHALCVLYCDGRGMMADRIAALRTANIYEPHVYCHLTSCVRILKSSPDEIQARANFSVIRTMQDGDSTIFACGRSIDVIVPRGGRLLFKDRLVVMDSRRVDTLLVIPI
jgi:anthranilate 1,2-dioxygenase small subunit